MCRPVKFQYNQALASLDINDLTNILCPILRQPPNASHWLDLRGV